MPYINKYISTCVYMCMYVVYVCVFLSWGYYCYDETPIPKASQRGKEFI